VTLDVCEYIMIIVFMLWHRKCLCLQLLAICTVIMQVESLENKLFLNMWDSLCLIWVTVVRICIQQWFWYYRFGGNFQKIFWNFQKIFWNFQKIFWNFQKIFWNFQKIFWHLQKIFVNVCVQFLKLAENLSKISL